MKILFCMIVALLLGMPQSLLADPTKKDLAACSDHKDGMQRLACFDKLAMFHGAIAKTENTPVKDSGKWNVSTKTSPIDDSKNVYLQLSADKQIQDKFGRAQTPELYIRCAENKTNLFISFGTFLGSDSTKVTTRLDKEKARNQSWSISTDHEAIFDPQDIATVKSLMEHDTFLVQLTPYGESPVMTTFDVRGLKEAIKPLREACGW